MVRSAQESERTSDAKAAVFLGAGEGLEAALLLIGRSSADAAGFGRVGHEEGSANGCGLPGVVFVHGS